MYNEMIIKSIIDQQDHRNNLLLNKNKINFRYHNNIKCNKNYSSSSYHYHYYNKNRIKLLVNHQLFINYNNIIIDNKSFSKIMFYCYYILLSLLLLLNNLIIIETTKIDNEINCKFPEHWWGQWFQKGITNTITITLNQISNKGYCYKNYGDKYIIENRTDRCFRCLVISERHLNILQYKETSYCYPLTEYTNEICFDINGDAPLYSLFRVNTSPIKCPFNGPFTFSYSKGIMNECRDPLSTIDECTDDRHLLFKFRACIDIYGSESKVEEFECLADWKEGSYRYMVGKLYHQSATTDEDRFRCFVFERNNTDYIESYNIGQSGDASCEGLFSPRDGSRIFKLRKSNSIQPSCEFPSWITDAKIWTTLDNRNVYDFTSIKQFTVIDMKQTVYQRAKCIRSDDVSFQYRFNTSRFIIHITVQCSSGYACMNAYQRDDRIIELQIGNIVSDINEACSLNNFNVNNNNNNNNNLRPTNFITLTTMDQETRSCELNGIFSIRTKIPSYYNNQKIISNHSSHSRLVSLLDSRFMCQEKALKLRSNCDEPELFQFICTTDNRVKNFYCRGGWKENNTQFFTVSLIDKFNYEYCISYNIDSKEIRLIRNSHFCYRNNNNNNNDLTLPSRSFRPSTINDHHQQQQQQYLANNNKYASIKYDDSISFSLIREGSCHRSNSYSIIIEFKYKQFILLLLLSLIFIFVVNNFQFKS